MREGMRVKEQPACGVPFRPARAWRELGAFLYILKAGPAGGRLRRTSSAGGQSRYTLRDANRTWST
jgi:hypothetical protein